MACCDCCCGGETCSEGQEGKCCCGGSSGECCQPTEFCCSGECSPEPCPQLTVVLIPLGQRYAGSCWRVAVTAPPGPASSVILSLAPGSVATASDFYWFPTFVQLPSSSSDRTGFAEICSYYACASHADKSFAVVASGGQNVGSATSNWTSIRYRLAPVPSQGSWSGTSSVAEGSSGTQTLELFSNQDALMCGWLFDLDIIYQSATAPDVTLSSSQQTVTVDPGNPRRGTLSVGFTAATDSVYEGAETFVVRAKRWPQEFYSPPITIVDGNLPPTYALTPSVTSVAEGQCVSFSVTTTNIPNGTALTWSVNHLSTTNSDFPSSYLSGSVTINNNSGSFTVCTYNDTLQEQAETFSVILRHNGVVKAESVPITIEASDQLCPTFDTNVNAYLVTLQSTSCTSSWFNSAGNILVSLVSSSSTSRTYQSGTISWVPQSYGGTTVEHTISVEIGTKASGTGTNYMRVIVGASDPYVTYSNISFAVNCATMQFTVSNTSGGSITNPAKSVRWSGSCTQDYPVQVAWSTPAQLQSIDPVPSGPGTELKGMLAKVGITATENCTCNKRAKAMDERGVEWCENNIDTIVGWLAEEAKKRGLPFIAMVGRMLVKRAIKKAKRDSKK